jgi:hypothetical protein
MELAKLQDTFFWPKVKPDMVPNEEPIFFGPHIPPVFDYLIPKDAKLIVEIGSWLGTSIKYFAQICPQAELVAIDTWKGSVEHRNGEINDSSNILPTLYEQFLVNTWDFKRPFNSHKN